MNLFEALHNLVEQLLNRSSDAHAAADVLHDVMVASGHATAAAKLDTVVTEATEVAAVASTIIPAAVSVPIVGASVVSPPGA